MKKSLFVVVWGVLSVGFLFSQSTDRLSFMLAPSVEIPLGPGLDSNQGDTPYSIGGAATFKGDYDIGDPLGLFGRAAVGYSYLPVGDGELGETDDLSILSLGAGFGYDVPLGGAERFSLKLSGTGGVYQAILGTETASNLYASAGTAATFALSPTFSLGAEV